MFVGILLPQVILRKGGSSELAGSLNNNQKDFLEYYEELKPLIFEVEDDYPTDVNKDYPYPMLEDGDVAQAFWRADEKFKNSLAKFLKSKDDPSGAAHQEDYGPLLTEKASL